MAPCERPGPSFGASRPAALAVAALLGACATHGADDANDPIEPLNRAIFAFNQTLDMVLIKPVAKGYGYVVPEPGRTAIRNFIDNLKAPVIFANDLLQGEGDRAGVTLGRFMINTTVGLLGLIDFATMVGYQRHNEDFGQTLAVWGVGEGPYLVLPILGPSNPRDAAGIAVDWYAFSPVHSFAPTDAQYAYVGTDAVDTRQRYLKTLDDLEKGSLDFYATIRSAYRQRRAAEIRNGAPAAPDQQYEDIFKDDADAPTPAK